MSLTTSSSFIYGYNVTESTKTFYVDEGSGVVAFDLDVGDNTLTSLLADVQAKFLANLVQIYTITVNKSTRVWTISAPLAFDLLPSTAATSAFDVLGYTIDHSGLITYDSDVASGAQYLPQFKLQNFIPFNHDKRSIKGVVSVAPSGITKASDFGFDKLMSCDFTWITDLDLGIIDNNPTGVQDVLDFMDFAITKGPIEFAEDVGDLNTFTPCILESTQTDKKGLGYKLVELARQGMPNLYRIKKLKFREIAQ